MSLTSTVTQNIGSGTESIVFYSGSGLQIESITYSASGITYAAESRFALSLSDLGLLFSNKVNFYNSLLVNFPTLSNYLNGAILPVCQMKIYTSNGPNIIQYFQSSTASPVSLVYNISFDESTLTAIFAARTNPITITFQEYLIGFQFLRIFFNQCLIY